MKRKYKAIDCEIIYENMFLLKKGLLAILFLGLLFQIVAQDIPWSKDISLEWNDFKCDVPQNVKFDAYTHCKLKYEFEQVKGREMVLITKASFMPDRSWSKEKKQSAYILLHEQLHFDIYEGFRRKLLKRIVEERALEQSDFAERIQSIFKKTFSELLEFQDEYDKVTAHSQNIEQQKVWSDKILDMLMANEGFASDRLYFNLKVK